MVILFLGPTWSQTGSQSNHNVWWSFRIWYMESRVGEPSLQLLWKIIWASLVGVMQHLSIMHKSSQLPTMETEKDLKSVALAHLWITLTMTQMHLISRMHHGPYQKKFRQEHPTKGMISLEHQTQIKVKVRTRFPLAQETFKAKNWYCKLRWKMMLRWRGNIQTKLM